MKTKKVAKMDLEFSAVGFGCWSISGPDVWMDTSDADSIRTINKAIDVGINFFDTAPIYGMGHSEEVLGKAIKGRRDQIIIASKCGLVWDDQKRVTLNLTEKSLLKEIDDTLRRLQTDHIEIYQMHWPDPGTPIEETMQALQKIKQSGKIRYIGVSNFSLDLTKAAAACGEIATSQVLYNMLERNPTTYHQIGLSYRTEKEIIPYCLEQGMALFPYSPLFQGLLSGKYLEKNQFNKNDVRADNPKLKGENLENYLKVINQLNTFAQKIDKPLSQVAVNWLIQNEAVTSVISGSHKERHVIDSAASCEWELSPAMLDELEAIINQFDFIEK